MQQKEKSNLKFILAHLFLRIVVVVFIKQNKQIKLLNYMYINYYIIMIIKYKFPWILFWVIVD